MSTNFHLSQFRTEIERKMSVYAGFFLQWPTAIVKMSSMEEGELLMAEGVLWAVFLCTFLPTAINRERGAIHRTLPQLSQLGIEIDIFDIVRVVGFHHKAYLFN